MRGREGSLQALDLAFGLCGATAAAFKGPPSACLCPGETLLGAATWSSCTFQMPSFSRQLQGSTTELKQGL